MYCQKDVVFESKVLMRGRMGTVPWIHGSTHWFLEGYTAKAGYTANGGFSKAHRRFASLYPHARWLL